MKRSSGLMVFVITCACLLSSIAQADEVVLTSGERFTSDKIWEEKGKIRFNMHGLVVSVQKSDVATIIRKNGSVAESQSPAPRIQPGPQNRMQPSPAPSAASPQPAKFAPSPPAPVPRPAPQPKKKPEAHQKLKGIGFEGITWHMRPTELSGLSKIGTEEIYGGIDQYWQPEGPLALGGALLDGLVFGFWQDRLYTIMMWVDGKPGYKRLKNAVFDRYGPGQTSKNRQDQYVWVDDRTTDRLLEFDTDRNIGVFWMRSRDIDTLIKQRYPDAQEG